MSGEDTVAHTGEGPDLAGTRALITEEVVEISIPRDLAVTLVGSDAGKENRIKPKFFAKSRRNPILCLYLNA